MSAGAALALDTVAARLAPTTLDETVEAAGLLTRTDRKYIIPPCAFHELHFALGDDLQVLEIAGRRCFRYESVYFDTPDLASYRGAAHDRRRRFKIRTRTYLDSGTCMLELKARSGRDETIKERMPYAVADRHGLSPEALTFIAERIDLPRGGHELAPVLTTSYRRSTLVDPRTRSRLTVDADLVCRDMSGREIALRDRLLVETKSAGAPVAADRVLWAQGHRPEPMSKYCIGMAGLDPTLPANRWNRPLRRYFGWLPERRAC